MRRHLICLAVLLALHPLYAASNGDSIFKGVKKVLLKNGATVLINENHSQPLVSVQVWAKVGSIYESPETAGLTHFIEHLIFKGSKNFPGDAMTRMVETNGGMINAATSKEFTEYYIDIQKDGFEESVRALADAMSNALFPQEEIDRERPVVIEEIVRSGDNHDSVLYDLFNEAMFVKTPYRHNVIGSEQVIRKVSRDDILAYYHKHYIPSNLIVSVAGDFDARKAEKVIEETFGSMPKAEAATEQPAIIEDEHKPIILAKTIDIEHGYWIGGFLGPDISSDDQFAADTVMSILGGSRSSRLYRKLREEKRLVYGVGSSFWSQRGTGLVAVNAVFDPKNEKMVIDAVSNELTNMQNSGPSEEELARAKVVAKSQWYFGQESFHDRASTIAYWNLMGRPELADTYINRLEKVTAKDVTDFMKKYYGPYGLNQAALIPKQKNAR